MPTKDTFASPGPREVKWATARHTDIGVWTPCPSRKTQERRGFPPSDVRLASRIERLLVEIGIIGMEHMATV